MPATPSRELVWNIVDDEAIILDVTTGEYFSLNPIATEIWKLLQQGTPPDELVQSIARKYETDRTTVAGDLAELLLELRTSRLWGAE